MNNVSMIGRLTKDPEVRYSNNQNNTAVARFTVAVDRRFKRDGEPTADFINCLAFGKTAEFIEKYFAKGMRIGLTGRIQTGHYDKQDGTRVYTTEVVADAVEFTERANGSSTPATQTNQAPEQEPDEYGFIDVPEDISEELPFN